MNAWEFLMDSNEVCHFMSRERPGRRASNSELKRWIQNQVLRIDGVVAKWDDKIVFPINSCTLFTKSKRITLL